MTAHQIVGALMVALIPLVITGVVWVITRAAPESPEESQLDH